MCKCLESKTEHEPGTTQLIANTMLKLTPKILYYYFVCIVLIISLVNKYLNWVNEQVELITNTSKYYIALLRIVVLDFVINAFSLLIKPLNYHCAFSKLKYGKTLLFSIRIWIVMIWIVSLKTPFFEDNLYKFPSAGQEESKTRNKPHFWKSLRE